MEDGVAGLDMGKKGVAKALALRRAFHQPSDVSHVQEGWFLAGWLVEFTEVVEPIIWYRDPTFIRVDGAEGEVLGGRLGLGEDVEEGGLAYVGEAHNSTLEVGAHTANQGAHLWLFLL